MKKYMCTIYGGQREYGGRYVEVRLGVGGRGVGVETSFVRVGGGVGDRVFFVIT